MELELGLELELELGWEPEWKLTWELELQPHKSRELQLDPPKSAFWAQMALLGPSEGVNGHLVALLGPLSKPGKCCIEPRQPAIQSSFSFGDSH